MDNWKFAFLHRKKYFKFKFYCTKDIWLSHRPLCTSKPKEPCLLDLKIDTSQRNKSTSFSLILCIAFQIFGQLEFMLWLVFCLFIVLVMSLWQSTWDKQLKRKKDLFWPTVSEVSAHGCLVPFPWACDKIDHHGRKLWCSKTAHPVVERKQRAGEEGVPMCPSTRSHPLKVLLPSNSATGCVHIIICHIFTVYSSSLEISGCFYVCLNCPSLVPLGKLVLVIQK
jgi:hypothetical protein